MRAFGFLHRLFPLGMAFALIGGVIGVATAAQPVRVDPLSDFQSLQQTIQKLKQDAEKAECGGWTKDPEQSVQGKIAQVSGVPGHNNGFFPDPETLKSGLARRAGTFTFPPSTSGKSTACSVQQESEDHCGNKFPYIHDPYSDSTPSCIPPSPPYPPTPPGASEKKCEWICDELNKWVRDAVIDDRKVSPVWKAEKCRKNNCPSNETPPSHESLDCIEYTSEEPIDHCTNVVLYCCTDAFLFDTPNANCIPCSGENEGTETGCRNGKSAPSGKTFVSFYRKYSGSYSRQKVTEVPNDKNSMEGLTVKCYARLNDPYMEGSVEFDPKLKRTTPPDQHCVIDFMLNMGALKTFQSMKGTQKGKGLYEQSSSSSDPTFPPQTRNTMKDLWVNGFSGAFSMLNGEKIGEEEEDLLLQAPHSLLVLDTTSLIPTAQISKTQLFSSGSLIRAFDDTVSLENPDFSASTQGMEYVRPGRRTITEWWQEQETQMHKILTPPIVRMLLPSPAADGIDVDTPLLNPKTVSTTQSSSADGLPPHTKAIDIQIHADTPDLLDEVSQELTDSLLLNVTEAPITVVVPLASPAELRAMAQGWLSWGQARKDLDGETGRGAEETAKKLQEYAKQIDEVRAMRAELAQYAGRLLTFQKDMSTAIARWLQANVDGFNAYQSEWEQRFSSYQTQWQQVQSQMRRFSDKTNFPWCRNDRFTTPVYSFLDPWMPGQAAPRDLALDIDRQPSQGRSSSDLPRMEVQPMPDLVFDFSALRIGSGGVLLPVLKPVQIRIDMKLFRPPTSATSSDEVAARLKKINALPDKLPAVPTIFKEVIDKMLPSEMLKSEPPASFSETLPSEPGNASSVLQRMTVMLVGMNDVYETFWKSLLEDRSGDIAKWNCVDVGTLPCVQVEMDLVERFTRMGARPAVLLKEDLKSVGYLRTDSSASSSSLPFSAPDPIKTKPQCPRADWACQVLNAETVQPRNGWRIEGMERIPAEEEINKLRDKQREKTLPIEEEDAFRYDVGPNDILPSFNVPQPIKLISPTGSSSSSSSR